MNTYVEMTPNGGFEIVEYKNGLMLIEVEYPAYGGMQSQSTFIPFSDLIPRGTDLNSQFDESMTYAYFIAAYGKELPGAQLFPTGVIAK